MTENLITAINVLFGRPWHTLHIWQNQIIARVVIQHRAHIHFITCEKIHDHWVATIDGEYELGSLYLDSLWEKDK